MLEQVAFPKATEAGFEEDENAYLMGNADAIPPTGRRGNNRNCCMRLVCLICCCDTQDIGSQAHLQSISE